MQLASARALVLERKVVGPPFQEKQLPIMLIKSPLVQKENKLVKYCFISHIILKHQHKIMKVPGKPHF